jgi:hypothetical protein
MKKGEISFEERWEELLAPLKEEIVLFIGGVVSIIRKFIL